MSWCARTSSRVTCFRSYSASWEIHAFCSPANASRCVKEIRSASTRGVGLTSAFIRTTGRHPANGRTRRRYRNERSDLATRALILRARQPGCARGISLMPQFARIFSSRLLRPQQGGSGWITRSQFAAHRLHRPTPQGTSSTSCATWSGSMSIRRPQQPISTGNGSSTGFCRRRRDASSSLRMRTAN